MPTKRTHPSSDPRATSASPRLQTPRLKGAPGDKQPSKQKPRTPKEKKAAIKKYLASLDPDKRKKIIAALAQKQQKKKSQAPSDVSDTPSAPDETIDPEPSVAAPASNAVKAKRPRSARSPSTKILSKNLYRKAGGIMLKRRVVQVLSLLLFVGLGFAWIAFIAVDQYNVMIILDASTKGWVALENEEFDSAKANFAIALDAFTEYNGTRNAWWRRPDIQLTQRMLRVAKGWRIAGDTRKAIETFHQTSLFLPEGFDSWQGEQFREKMEEFLDPGFWSEPDAIELYTLLVSADPASWGEGSTYLIEKTEQVGFWLSPLQKRFREAEIIVYGTPRNISDSKDGEFVVDAEIIYKADREPGLFYFQPVEEFTQIERDRLEWYLNSEEKCILFGTINENKARLNSIEGIVISRPTTVEEFNSIIYFSE